MYIDYLQNLLGLNKRTFPTDLILHECVADANLKGLVKIENESLLKQLFRNVQHLTFIISTNFKILHMLNKGVCALNDTKSIILRAFLENRYFKFRVACKTPGYTNIICMRLKYSKVKT